MTKSRTALMKCKIINYSSDDLSFDRQMDTQSDNTVLNPVISLEAKGGQIQNIQLTQ